MSACPSCSAAVDEGPKFCGACGATLSAEAPRTETPAPPPAPAAPPSPPPSLYAAPPAYPPPYGPYGQVGYPLARPRTALPIAGGALLLVAGILGLISGAATLAVSGSTFVPGIGDIGAILVVCGLLVIVFSVFATIGGALAIQRKLWGVALTGAVLGLFSIGPVFVSSILSLIALILIAVSRHEFR